MEESHRKSDSVAFPSKSFGALVQINSIAIDISSAMEEIESPAPHEHFSIRGYAAGMRKKDWKACSPFVSGGNDVDPVYNLPPLLVPRFRWWQCSDCIPDIAPKRSLEMVVAGRSDASTSSCKSNLEKNGLLLHSGENIGNKLGSVDFENGEENDPIKTIMNSSLCSIEGQKATACSKGKTDVKNKEAGIPCPHMPDTNSLQIRQIHDTADAPNMVSPAERPSCIVDEAENASSGSDGAFSALLHKRKPKLRSLADIMVEERNPTSDNPRTRSTSSGGMQVTSTETETVVGSQFESDAPAEAAKAARSPPRKRKIALEEERGRSGVIHPRTAAKRLRGLVLDTEKNCRRVESDSESEGVDGSMRLDFQLGAKTHGVKPKKDKALDVSKKMRQKHTEDAAVPMRELPKINGMCSASLQKHAVSPGTGFGKLVHASSTLGEMRPYVSSSLSGQHVERISNLSKSKTPEVEADHDSLMPSGKNILVDGNTKEKVALDLSLNSFMDVERNSNNLASFRQHTCIPDLNEAFPLKTAMTQGKQLPTIHEKRSLSFHKTLDVSASCSKETTREGKRQLGVYETQNKDNNTELGASDDIPMEIVELLAKNQRERALGNSRRHLLPEGINNSTRGYPAPYLDGRPGMINFPLANSRNGVTVTNGNMGVSQNIPISFSQLKKCQLDMSKPKSQFSFFSSSTPSQQRKTQYSASSSIITEPRPLRTGTDLLWPPTRENTSFHLSIQPNNIGVHSFSDQCHKGKSTIRDIRDGKDKKAVHGAAVLKEGIVRPGSTSVGYLDHYSNDTIPAMQLLSLMDQRTVSVSSFEVGSKSFLDKPFSPCNHHPQLNGKENHSFHAKSLFSQNNHSKALSTLRYESSKKSSSYLKCQIPPELGNSKATPLEASTSLAIQPARSSSSLGVCTLNRNPADFSIPDARNEFTLSGKDLKFRKRNASKEKSRPVHVEGRKKYRVRKDPSGKECLRK